MFSSIGWGEIVVLGLAALFIFGPERLPHLAQDAAAGLKRLRGVVTGARGQVHDTLGPEFGHLTDLDLRQYHPKTLIRRALTDEDDDRTHPTANLAASRARVADRSQPRPEGRDQVTGSTGQWS